MSFGQETSSQTANKLRSTFVYGNFGNFDTSTGSILANAAFQRNVLIGNDLTLGLERLDSSGNAIDSGGNIKFLLNKIPYSIPLRTLSYLMNVTSDIQQQISNIPSSNIQTQITDISWIPGTINRTNISNACSTEILTFSTSINNITASTFGYLSNVTSNIQQQINTVSSNLTNIGNNPLVLSSSLNVAGMATLSQAQINLSLSVLQNISLKFSQKTKFVSFFFTN